MVSQGINSFLEAFTLAQSATLEHKRVCHIQSQTDAGNDRASQSQQHSTIRNKIGRLKRETSFFFGCFDNNGKFGLSECVQVMETERTSVSWGNRCAREEREREECVVHVSLSNWTRRYVASERHNNASFVCMNSDRQNRRNTLSTSTVRKLSNIFNSKSVDQK